MTEVATETEQHPPETDAGTLGALGKLLGGTGLGFLLCSLGLRWS